MDDIPVISDEMMDELARRLRGMQRAQERMVNPVPARGTSRSLVVTARPGEPAPIINTVRGYPTSISFEDNTGQPWPIHWENMSNASQPGSTDCNNSEAQTAQAASGKDSAIPAAVFSTGFHLCVPMKGGNTVILKALSENPRGGMQIMLEGMTAPIAFMMQGTSDSFDSTVTVRVGRRGPNAKTEIFTSGGRPGPVTGGADLQQFLDGAPPANARPLLVRGAPPDGVQAWQLGDNMYIRTSARIISPMPIRREYSGDLGINEIQASPVVLATAEGHTFSIALESQDR